MIPGGWYKAPGGDIQHWRRHGIGESACKARVHTMDNGSLLPYEGIPQCPDCKAIFVLEAAKALPKYERIVDGLRRAVCTHPVRDVLTKTTTRCRTCGEEWVSCRTS